MASIATSTHAKASSGAVNLEPGLTSEASANAHQDGVRDSFGQFATRLKTAGVKTARALDPRNLAAVARPSLRLAAGAGIVGASSLAFAPTVAKPLARMTAAHPGATALYTDIPWVGKLINTVLGKAGALSALAVAAPLLGLAMTFMQAQGSSKDNVHWFLTHAAIGLSMSPMWLLPMASVAGLLPALTLACGCMVGVSMLLGERLEKKQATVQMLLVGVTLVLGGAPLPALLATGGTLGAALTSATVTLAGGAALLASYLTYSNFAALSSDSTGELTRCAVDQAKIRDERLNLPGERSPTVLCPSEELLEYVQYIKTELGKGRRQHVRPLLMHGEPGTGKTAISRSLGNALGAKTYVISPAKINASANPALAMRTLFEQAKILGGRAIFCFDDAEHLFADRKSNKKFDKGYDALTLMTTTLNDCLDGIEQDAYELLMVVLSTNNRSYLDESIKQRFAACDVKIAAPDRQAFPDVLKTCYARARKLGGSKVAAQLPQEVVDEAMGLYDQELNDPQPTRITGRELLMLFHSHMPGSMQAAGWNSDVEPTAKQLNDALQKNWPKVMRIARQDAYPAQTSTRA